MAVVAGDAGRWSRHLAAWQEAPLGVAAPSRSGVWDGSAHVQRGDRGGVGHRRALRARLTVPGSLPLSGAEKEKRRRSVSLGSGRQVQVSLNGKRVKIALY